MTEVAIIIIVFACVTAPIVVVGGIYYLKKRFEHKQILAAIEKGTPLSEIVPRKPIPAGPAWIRYVSVGIALLVIGFAFILGPGIGGHFEIGIAYILLGVGVAWLVRGLLHRKYYLKNQSGNGNSNAANKASA